MREFKIGRCNDKNFAKYIDRFTSEARTKTSLSHFGSKCPNDKKLAVHSIGFQWVSWTLILDSSWSWNEKIGLEEGFTVIWAVILIQYLQKPFAVLYNLWVFSFKPWSRKWNANWLENQNCEGVISVAEHCCRNGFCVFAVRAREARKTWCIWTCAYGCR